MSATSLTSLLVCVTCRKATGLPDGSFEEPGRMMAARLDERLRGSGVAVRPVQCLSVCKRPCTVALQAPGKWTYVVGDLDADADVDAVAEGALLFDRAPDGIVPWRERPLPFRKNVVARVPPLPDATPTPETPRD